MFKTGFPPEKIKTTHNTMLNLPNDNYKWPIPLSFIVHNRGVLFLHFKN
jgi:hypothetical protein